jgi:nucleoside-diphosphate-sugar epimerase
MRVLLTGATGFIGSHLARHLVRNGCEVHALVRESSDFSRIRDLIPCLRLVHCDLNSRDQVKALIPEIGADVCIHAAWYVVHGKYLHAAENSEMLGASLNLATMLAESGCRRFVGLGTCFEYDTEAGYLCEDSPLQPRSLYAATKMALQVALGNLAARSSMSVAWARLFYLYGSFEDPRRLVPSVIRPLLQNQRALTTPGEQVKDFLHIEDCAAAIWAIAQSSITGPVNIGSGQPVAVRDLVFKIAKLVDRPELAGIGALPCNPSDPMFVCADNRRLVEGTGWKPQYDLQRGLENTIEWWRCERP